MVFSSYIWFDMVYLDCYGSDFHHRYPFSSCFSGFGMCRLQGNFYHTLQLGFHRGANVLDQDDRTSIGSRLTWK